MLMIRLQRVGKTKAPTYRVIISEKARDTQGTYLEKLGTFNPHVQENGLLVDVERVKYWLGKGAEASATLHNLFVKAGITEGAKKKAVFLSKKRKVKLGEKDKAKVAAAEKAKADAEAKAAKEAEAKAAKEAEEKAAAEQAKIEAEKPAEVAPVEEVKEEVKPEAPVAEEKPVDTTPSETV
ncbi:MAG: 30S ribosomal protein S16 [Candidatus Magasanikbacteria bacterium RIFOXYD2_FULL_41_14]|uniref:Small ribosomal subunit protein bS16 n=1 Tax=Candidatus Magasanikbacteria bacterium RIFOXYD2_FULL_41_14 TaxID=1798709 RepID=A0A1F6PCR8_9BACT|nr:MAG: 30S ribosomal protein S16 [Candidatus Magasanikbacteria bacterium RIFOXYD2_FULL_41_14]